MTHPAPNSELTGDQGSSLRDTHRATDDPWAALEGLAKAATPGPWSYRDMRPSTYGPAFVDAADVQSLAICGEAVGRSDTHGFCLRVDSEVRMSNAAFIAAANPATVLKLIEAARASQVGMSEANEPKPDVAGARERLEGYLEGELHLLQDADLRLILSAYDRQADEIQRQGEDNERLLGALESIADDDEPEPGNHNTNDLLARMYWEIATKATRARQGGPDHG